MSNFPLLLFDNDLNFVGQIDDYNYLRWVRRYRRSGEFEFKINRYKNFVNLLLPSYFIAQQFNGTYRIGRIGSKNLSLSETGKISEDMVVRGLDATGVFKERICFHLTGTGTGYDDQTGVNGETAMRHYVDRNCITPTDPNRVVPFLVLDTNFNRGANVNVRGRFQTVEEILESICLATQLGYEHVFDLPNKEFIFKVLEGADHSASTGTNPVIFSPEFDNVKILGYSFNEIDTRTFAYVGGQGEANLRTIQTTFIGSNTGYNRREIFVDARDLTTTAELTQRGNERLAEVGVQEILEVEVLQQGPFQYLVDYNLGDIVTAVYPEIASSEQRIIEIIEEYTVEIGQRITLTLGNEYPDLKSFLRLSKKNTETEVRR